MYAIRFISLFVLIALFVYAVYSLVRWNLTDKKLRSTINQIDLLLQDDPQFYVQRTIRINTHRNAIPFQAEGGDWIDLTTAEDVTMQAGEFRLISLGVSMEIPDWYEAIVAPRSSTPGRHGIIMANSIGVIDNSFNGDGDIWRFPALAFRETVIPAGTRIAQFRIFRNQSEITFRAVDKLGNADRGGIGSTGV